MLNNDFIRRILIFVQIIAGKWINEYKTSIITEIGRPGYTIIGIIFIGTFMYLLWYSEFRKSC